MSKSTVATAMQPIVDQLGQMTSDIPGWSPADQLFALYMLALSTRDVPGDIWEIGAWCGRSTCALALASQNTDGRKVHSIDLFPNRTDWYADAKGNYSFKVTIGGKVHEAYTDQTVWKEPFERDIATMYAVHGDSLQDIFTETVRRKGFADLVASFRGTPQEYARVNKKPIAFAFVDGDHSYDAVCADIETVDRLLLPHGWIAFDDAFTSYEGVNRAIEDKILKTSRFEMGHQLTRKCFAARKK